MKQFQQNLLIGLALALCLLCLFQWHDQTLQRKEIMTLNGMSDERNVTLQGATNSLAALNEQLGRMDAQLAQLQHAADASEQLAARQHAEILRLRSSGAALTNEISQYQSAVDTLASRLKEAYAVSAREHEAITNLVAQRDDFVKKFNESMKERNGIVDQYNQLADQMKQLLNARTNGSPP